MLRVRRHEHGVPFLELHGLAFHVERSPPLEHVVHLVVLVRLLAVGLRRDEDVHPDLESRRLVHDLVAAAARSKTLSGPLDIERMQHEASLTTRSGRGAPPPAASATRCFCSPSAERRAAHTVRRRLPVLGGAKPWPGEVAEYLC